MNNSQTADEGTGTTGVQDRWRKAQEYELRFWQKYARRVPDREKHIPRELDYVLSAGLEGRRVLEVGCGPMGTIYYVPGALRVGIDPLAREYVKDLGFSACGVDLVAAMGERLPFVDDTFDVIICGNVLDHVDQPGPALAEICRVLRSHGSVVMAVHVIPRWLVSLRWALDRIDTAHPHHMTKSDVYRMIEAADLEPGDGRSMSPKLTWRSVKSAVANLAMRNLVVTCRPTTPEARQ
jgi:ubiquinone/menaquinone biosynthesis C-methylase UbiE